MIGLAELRIFVAVAEAGSFVAAANRLGIAPPIVSRSIKALEVKLNTTLFSRTTRKIAITNDGRWLLAQAHQTVTRLAEIEAHFSDPEAEPEGPLRVDAATPFALHLVAPALLEFTELYPKIEITLESNETVTDLIDGKVDVAIRIGHLRDSTLKAKKLGETSRAMFASPAYLKRRGSPNNVEDLGHHKCLGFSGVKYFNVWPFLTDGGEPVSIKPSMWADNAETLKKLAIYGNGLVCLSKFAVKDELASGELVEVMPEKRVSHAIPIYAVYFSEQAVGRHIRLFLDFLSEKLEFEM